LGRASVPLDVNKWHAARTCSGIARRSSERFREQAADRPTSQHLCRVAGAVARISGRLQTQESVVRWSMKASYLLKGMVAALLFGALAGVVSAQAPIEPKGQLGGKYVFVTGSNIPQRVKVKSVGTATVSPVRVIKNESIRQQSGRISTERVLASEDPSLHISGHGGIGGL